MRTLDVVLANQLHDDPVTMAVWRRDRRVAYPNRAKSVAPAVSAPPPTADARRPGRHRRRSHVMTETDRADLVTHGCDGRIRAKDSEGNEDTTRDTEH